MYLTRICYLVIFLLTFTFQAVQASTKMVIAKNGAGKNLIENTLPAATLASAMGAEYLELHVVMTADNQLVVFHDLTLERLTDVSEVFPDRKRENGSSYVIDFTLDELRRLHVLGSKNSNESPLTLGIPSLVEELGLLRHLETILNRQLGIVLEIRQPWFHLQAGKDISTATLDALTRFKYTTAQSKLYLQCFDPDELQRIQNQLMPERQMILPLIQLIGANDGAETKQRNQEGWDPYNYDWLYTNIGLRMVASYAVAIALPTKVITDVDGNLPLAEYIGEAHRLGLMVLASPLNIPSHFPSYAPDFPALLNFYFFRAEIDGIYTDSFADAQSLIHQQNESIKAGLPPLDAEQQPLNEEPPQLQEDLPPFFKNLNLSRPAPPDLKKAANEEKVPPEQSE